MNRSYSKIRHIQEANQRLEKRIMSEQVQTTVTQTGDTPTITNPFGRDKLNEYLGKTVNLYADPENKKFLKQIRIDEIEQNTEKRYVEDRLGNLLIYFNFWNDPDTGKNPKGSMDSFSLEYSCDNPDKLKWGTWFEKNWENFVLNWGIKVVGLKPQSRIYSNNLTAKLKQEFCTVSSGGASVPKATFASADKSQPSNLA